MKFQAKTQEEIDAANLCEEGDYPFTIAEAAEQTSKRGQPMFKLKLLVHADGERDWHIFDYVSPAFMEHRLLHLCEGTGLFPQYAAGELEASELVGQEGHCRIIVQEAKGGYPAKNVVDDYLVPDRKKAMAENKTKASTPLTPPEDDDVPFN
jgi:hypothetical protein